MAETVCFDKLVYWYALENAVYKWKLVRSVMCCPHSAWYIFCPGSQDIWGWEGGGRPPPWSPNIYKFHICQEEHLNGGAQWRKVKNCIICDVLILRSQRECFEFWMYLNEKACLPPMEQGEWVNRIGKQGEGGYTARLNLFDEACDAVQRKWKWNIVMARYNVQCNGQLRITRSVSLLVVRDCKMF